MNLGEFHQLVSDSLRRGTTQDGQIPNQVRLAVMWMERNYNFAYMEQFRLLQLAMGDRTISLPSNKIVKSIKLLRLVGEDGVYRDLVKVHPSDLTGLSDRIRSYWMAGNTTLVLDAIPASNMAGEAVLIEYTDWPTKTDSKHPLIDIAGDVLLQQTLFFMAAYLRDTTMMSAYKVLRDEALNTLTRAEDETQYSGQAASMAYIPPNTV